MTGRSYDIKTPVSPVDKVDINYPASLIHNPVPRSNFAPETVGSIVIYSDVSFGLNYLTLKPAAAVLKHQIITEQVFSYPGCGLLKKRPLSFFIAAGHALINSTEAFQTLVAEKQFYFFIFVNPLLITFQSCLYFIGSTDQSSDFIFGVADN